MHIVERTLNISGCELTRLAAEAFASGVLQSKTLEAIDFGDRRLFSQLVAGLGMSDLDGPAVCPMMSMTQLDLSKVRLECGGVRGVEKGLGRLKSLEALQMVGNNFGSVSGARALAEHALSKLVKLKQLDLADCGINSTAMLELASGLCPLGALERLSETPVCS